MSGAGIFPPKRTPKVCLENLDKGIEGDVFDVVDGVVVRNNPIPAFFQWCAQHEALADKLDANPGFSLHVVYNVPAEPEGPLDQAPPPESADIVESAMTALELEQGRDTRQEVRQTNFLARLERLRRKATGGGRTPGGTFKILADEIAPAREITYRNAWEPTQGEFLKVAADGCRTTMETLYRDQIHQLQTYWSAPVKAQRWCTRLPVNAEPT